MLVSLSRRPSLSMLPFSSEKTICRLQKPNKAFREGERGSIFCVIGEGQSPIVTIEHIAFHMIDKTLKYLKK